MLPGYPFLLPDAFAKHLQMLSTLRPLTPFQRLHNVGDNIIRMFKSHGNPY
jgi:hypothetical protein